MDKLEAYSYLFSDSLMGSFIINFHNSFIYKIMMIFGGYNIYLIMIIAAIGNIVGAGLNYGIGYILRYFEKTEYVTDNLEKYEKLKKVFKKIYWLLLSLNFVPLIGSLAPILCGLFRVSFIKSIIFIGISNLLFYCYISYVI